MRLVMKRFKLFIALALLSAALIGCSNEEPVANNATADISGMWRILAIDTSEGAKVYLSESDTIMITFTSDSLYGYSKGLCGNTFFGAYEIKDNWEITVSSIISTEMACTESRYGESIYALQNADRFGKDNDLHFYYGKRNVKLYLKKITI